MIMPTEIDLSSLFSPAGAPRDWTTCTTETKAFPLAALVYSGEVRPKAIRLSMPLRYTDRKPKRTPLRFVISAFGV